MRAFKSLLTILLFTISSAFAAEQRAVFAGGCFWGVEAVFEELNGVIDVRSGYAGGSASNATYDEVSGGGTGHAESVEIRFDPAKISYEQLLNVFFVVAHDPTQIDRQGPDVGTQYRSVIFFLNDAQQRSARSFIDAIEASKALDKPVATQLVKFRGFYSAEPEHQNFVRRNPKHPYVVAHDLPKLQALKNTFPDLIRKPRHGRER